MADTLSELMEQSWKDDKAMGLPESECGMKFKVPFVLFVNTDALVTYESYIGYAKSLQETIVQKADIDALKDILFMLAVDGDVEFDLVMN